MGTGSRTESPGAWASLVSAPARRWAGPFNNPVVRAAVEAGVDWAITGGGEYLAQTKDPSLAWLARAAPKRGGAELVAKGQRGVDASIDALLQCGDKLLGTEVTFDVGGVRTQLDIVAERPDGTVYLIEAKTARTRAQRKTRRLRIPFFVKCVAYL